MDKNDNNKSIVEYIDKNKNKLPISYLFIKEVQPITVSHNYDRSRLHNSYFKVGVYRKFISISFLD